MAVRQKSSNHVWMMAWQPMADKIKLHSPTKKTEMNKKLKIVTKYGLIQQKYHVS